MMLRMIGRLGMNGGRYQAVEFCGEAVRALSMQERMTLSNMSAELGSQVGLVAPDATTEAWLREAGVRGPLDIAHWQSDPGRRRRVARFRRRRAGAAGGRPHSPANAADVSVHAGVAVQAAYIGACTGAKLDDLRAAAAVLRGRRVAAGVKLMVAPASLRDQNDAEREGVLQTLLEARAAAAHVLRRLRRLRRFDSRRRHGDLDHGAQFRAAWVPETAQVYLASPYSVAAAATGRIIDPREVLQ